MDLMTYLVRKKKVGREKAEAMIREGFVKVNGRYVKSNVDVDGKEVYFPSSLLALSLDFFDIFAFNKKWRLIEEGRDYFALSPPLEFAYFLHLLNSRLLVPERDKTKRISKYGNVVKVKEYFFNQYREYVPYSSPVLFSFSLASPLTVYEQVNKYMCVLKEKDSKVVVRVRFSSKEDMERRKEYISVFRNYTYKGIFISPYSSFAYLIFLKKKL